MLQSESLPHAAKCIPQAAFCIVSQLSIPIVCRGIYSQVLILLNRVGDSESVFPIQLKQPKSMF